MLTENASEKQNSQIGTIIGSANKRFRLDPRYAQYIIEHGSEFQDFFIERVLESFGNVHVFEPLDFSIDFTGVVTDYPECWQCPSWEEQLETQLQILSANGLSAEGLSKEAKFYLGKKRIWKEHWEFRGRKDIGPEFRMTTSMFDMDTTGLNPNSKAYKHAIRSMTDINRVHQEFRLVSVPVWDGLVVIPLPGKIAAKLGFGNLWEDWAKPIEEQEGVWANLLQDVLLSKFHNHYKKRLGPLDLVVYDDFKRWLWHTEQKTKGDFICRPYNAGRILAGYAPIFGREKAHRLYGVTTPSWINGFFILSSPIRMVDKDRNYLGMINAAERCFQDISYNLDHHLKPMFDYPDSMPKFSAVSGDREETLIFGSTIGLNTADGYDGMPIIMKEYVEPYK